ncbi:MAG: phosphoserine phosphatase SerB [Cycloclasticus sp. symbiont of Poecilosclerida sp. M]|nr:MAG: phosphoserine phosphatase SerB [Cycloclasticus sp. symbiont of Poecilosclerida sp. M]
MNKYVIHQTVLSDEVKAIVKNTFGAEATKADGFFIVESNQYLDSVSLADVRKALSCDINLIKAGFIGEDVGLLVTDMDSTLISIECIDEIADMLGLKKEVFSITEAAMRGELDFAESLTRRVTLLKGLPETELERVYDERLSLNLGAEKLIDYLKEQAIKLALVSGGFTFFTERLKKRLEIDYTLANTLEIQDGRLTGRVVGEIIGAQSKADLLVELSNKLGLQKQQVIAMGDGANDLLMMEQAGLSVAYHAKPTVQEQTDAQLNISGLDAVIDILKT